VLRYIPSGNGVSDRVGGALRPWSSIHRRGPSPTAMSSRPRCRCFARTTVQRRTFVPGLRLRRIDVILENGAASQGDRGGPRGIVIAAARA
jgi:hypothetical protein